VEFIPLKIDGAFEIVAKAFGDARGTFSTLFESAEFARNGLVTAWTGDNQSINPLKGTLRGLHFQAPPAAQTKLVRVVSGAVFDVAVDLRPSSASFGKWEAVELSAEKYNSIYVPRGCAHGFLTLTDNCIVLYKVDSPYTPQAEGGLKWDDPDLKIDWPISCDLTISVKDQNWLRLSEWKNPYT
jgi:dTDP-4-dehydrorhamnose 3,5-epimerase